nr:unnamed protein product [Callosobruchus analis]
MSATELGKLHLINGTVNTEKYLRYFREAIVANTKKALATGENFIFQQDGAACHKSKKALKWFSGNNISLLEWVSSSPDLSPIETLWHEMKKQLRANPARTVVELKERLQEIWDNFSPEYSQGLVNTMPQRVTAVIKSKGDVTQW